MFYFNFCFLWREKSAYFCLMSFESNFMIMFISISFLNLFLANLLSFCSFEMFFNSLFSFISTSFHISSCVISASFKSIFIFLCSLLVKLLTKDYSFSFNFLASEDSKNAKILLRRSTLHNSLDNEIASFLMKSMG